MAKQNKPPKLEMRLTFKTDPQTAYRLKAAARLAKLSFPLYLNRLVMSAFRESELAK